MEEEDGLEFAELLGLILHSRGVAMPEEVRREPAVN